MLPPCNSMGVTHVATGAQPSPSLGHHPLQWRVNIKCVQSLLLCLTGVLHTLHCHCSGVNKDTSSKVASEENRLPEVWQDQHCTSLVWFVPFVLTYFTLLHTPPISPVLAIPTVSRPCYTLHWAHANCTYNANVWAFKQCSMCQVPLHHSKVRPFPVERISRLYYLHLLS